MSANTKPENGFLNLLFNVIVPVFLLNKMSQKWGPGLTLLIALAFPLVYGIYDLVQRKKINALSILGLLNVSVTGSLALLGLGGIWFCVKEAFFPFLIGIFVFISAYTEKPLVKTILINPQVMDLDKLMSRIHELKQELRFEKLLRVSTLFLSASFFISAFLNFKLSLDIFAPLPEGLDSTAQSIMLNEQIAKMTTASVFVIMIPSMIILLGIMWYLFNGIKKITGFKIEEFMKS